MPAGVTIAGIHVGGLSPDAALAVVRTAFATPLPLVLGARKFSATPQELGAVAYAKAAVARARHAARGTRVPLNVVVHVARTRAYVDGLAAGFARAPVDSVLVLRNLEPWISKGAAGRKLDAPTAVRRIAQELVANARAALTLPVEALPQKVSRANYGPVIVIRRGSNHLYLYKGMQPWRTFQVATGQAIYPTPLGRFSIAVMWKNPWWYPPASPWAQGLKPVPPGPGNPLGTRWMGLTSPGVGIHGTPDSGSIGYSVSHGCIRMLIPDAEWLFDHVVIGTPVFIVAS
jgi:lipoprotein-anchoring transpeptidase ErfK/SrfK